MNEKLVEMVNQFREGKIGTPIEEHATKVFAFRDEFIAYVNGSNRSLEWWQAKLDRYSVHQIMAIAKEAEVKGVTFEEIESIRGEEFRRAFETAVKSINWEDLKVEKGV